ncbi:MAG: O-Antigen ligase [Pelotomaculum sp. PtaB.Bin104]|uniref:O-antigen ligase family protein n=1 Tax=Pelotomaculum isophthalicicum JI TaxID=947010 RepID=A0A9X4H5S5_9FIRM|nr:O-antigen ligase family protein [Pelotomaculum isophthalicicum]MDF9409888.1 O-antigen ligase family protein [Pelotomaculum isophthalicicum JI]OPX90890.1 MAG: O-Antigen ligase [Pelotomaculum sp. PtaB.Bin104]
MASKTLRAGDTAARSNNIQKAISDYEQAVKCDVTKTGTTSNNDGIPDYLKGLVNRNTAVLRKTISPVLAQKMLIILVKELHIMTNSVAKMKNKTTVVKKSRENNQWEFSHAIAFWGLMILLFLPPYFRGLFFQPEQERALISTAVIFWFAWLWKWSKRDNEFLSHPLDYFVLAFPIVYLISAFQAANYGLAVDEVVKTILYFLVYWLASRLIRDEKDITTILHVIYISALGVALAGLATTTGIIHINDGFKDGRIYSSFQYPNALASYLAAVTFIGFYLWRRTGISFTISTGEEQKKVPIRLSTEFFFQYLYTAGNFLLFTVFLGTKSQGGLLVFSLMLVIFIAGLPKGGRIPVFIHILLTGAFSGLAAWRFVSVAVNKSNGSAWFWLFAGLVLALVGQALYSLTERKGLLQWITVHRKGILAVILLTVLAGCAGVSVYVNTHTGEVRALLQLDDIHLRSAIERFYFYRDALKMFALRPLLGWGGGGWQEAYRSFQSYMYNSNQVHNDYLQIMVETGILGLLTITGIWASFLRIAHQLYQGARENVPARTLFWIITVAAVSIGAHAAIDFDLSLSAITLVLFTLFGIMRSFLAHPAADVEKKKNNKYVPPNNAVLAGASIASALILFFGGCLATAYSSYINVIQAKSYDQALSLIQKAIAYNPFNPIYYDDTNPPIPSLYHVDLLHLYQAQGKLDDAMAASMRAVELSKYNANSYADLSTLYSANKKTPEAVQAAEKALSLAPFQIQWYEFLSKTYLIAGYNELTAGKRDEAKEYFEKAEGVPAKIQIRMDTLSDEEKRLWKDAPPMTVTPTVKLSVGASQYLLGQWTEADSNLKATLDDDKNKGEAFLWLAVLRNKQDRAQEAQDFLAQAKKLSPDLAKDYEQLKSLPVLRR